MARLTLRLPEQLHRRLVARSRSTGKSLNQLVVDALQREEPEAGALAPSYSERLRSALGDLVLSEAEVAQLFADEPGDQELPILSNEDLRRLLPRLNPPLSQTVIDDREDRV